jgi:hypothetical protein
MSNFAHSALRKAGGGEGLDGQGWGLLLAKAQLLGAHAVRLAQCDSVCKLPVGPRDSRVDSMGSQHRALG